MLIKFIRVKGLNSLTSFRSTEDVVNQLVLTVLHSRCSFTLNVRQDF